MKVEQAWLLEGGTNAQAAATSYNLLVICDLHKELLRWKCLFHLYV